MVEVARAASHLLAERVDFALLEHPTLRARDHAARRPARQVPTLEDEARRAERAVLRGRARDHVAR